MSSEALDPSKGSPLPSYGGVIVNQFSSNSETARRAGYEGEETSGWLDIPTPAVDQYRFLISVPRVSYKQFRLLSEEAIKQDIKVNRSLNKSSRELPYRNYIMPQQIGGGVIPKMVCEGNTLLQLRGKIAQHDDSTDLQGKTNFLPNSIDENHRNSTWEFSLRTILNQLRLSVENLENIFSSTGLDAKEIRLHINTLEIAFDLRTDKYKVDATIMGLLDSLRNIYGIDGMKRIKNGTVLGTQASIGTGQTLSIYLKCVDLIRVEIRFKNSFSSKEDIKKLRSGNLEDWRELLEHCHSTAHTTVSKMFEYRKPDYPPSTSDVLIKVLEAVSKGVFPDLFRRLCEGDGQIQVRSRESALYRSIRALRKAGVLVKMAGQGKYQLSGSFRPILSISNAVDRSLKV